MNQPGPTIYDRVSRINRKMRNAENEMAEARSELNDLVATLGFTVVPGHDSTRALPEASFPVEAHIPSFTAASGGHPVVGTGNGG